jgi:BirA family biotin operon repressor/biotin-[acetyl-CoA-carboxylase] ligase
MDTKSKVLSLLTKNNGKPVSGAEIALCLGVSRNAVWKAVKALQTDGFKINAVTNKGYSLLADNDILSVGAIAPHLQNEALAAKIKIYKSLQSTNITAKEIASCGCEHGTVVIAHTQTGGKGRYGRGFFSPSGGIYLSLILHPNRLNFSTPTLVTAYAAVCVCETIEELTGKQPKIKWVNDVFLNGKKICGILTEAVVNYESGVAPWIVLGIGINFNLPCNLPKDLQKIVGAIYEDEHLPASTTRNQIAAALINKLTSEVQLSEEEMLSSYKARLMMLNKRVLVAQVEQPYHAQALDIDETGRLIVKKDSGEVVALCAGDISIVQF